MDIVRRVLEAWCAALVAMRCVELLAAVEQLNLDLGGGHRMPALERVLAEQAAAGGCFTLPSLLVWFPVSASGLLYPCLCAMFDEPQVDHEQRQAWQQGSVHAMNPWCGERAPRSAKAWWLNWRDAFG